MLLIFGRSKKEFISFQFISSGAIVRTKESICEFDTGLIFLNRSKFLSYLEKWLVRVDIAKRSTFIISDIDEELWAYEWLILIVVPKSILFELKSLHLEKTSFVWKTKYLCVLSAYYVCLWVGLSVVYIESTFSYYIFVCYSNTGTSFNNP